MKKEQLGLYFTLGDYGLETSLLVIQTLLEENLGLVEIGLPFSDPLLDGTVIQKSHGRSIEREELKWNQVISCLKRLSQIKGNSYLSVMTSFQMVFTPSRLQDLLFANGVLVTDYSATTLIPHCPNRVWFVSQDFVEGEGDHLKPPQSISSIYLTRIQGITGESQSAQGGLKNAIQKLKAVCPSVPLWVGFGISQAQDVDELVGQGATGGIVGSKFVNDFSTFAQHKSSEKLLLETPGFVKNWIHHFVTASRG